MYTLYETGALDIQTVGYFLYVQTLDSKLAGTRENIFTYPVLSAFGIILTAIILPITMIFRWLMNKYGPSAD